MKNKPNSINTNSPCVRNCCLNEIDICLGCFRHIDEIIAWKSYNDQQKSQVLNTCEKRKTDMTK